MDSKILSTEGPPVCLDLTRAIARERSESQWGHQGQLASDRRVHLLGMETHPAAVCLPSLRWGASLALVAQFDQ